MTVEGEGGLGWEKERTRVFGSWGSTAIAQAVPAALDSLGLLFLACLVLMPDWLETPRAVRVSLQSVPRPVQHHYCLHEALFVFVAWETQKVSRRQTKGLACRSLYGLVVSVPQHGVELQCGTRDEYLFRNIGS